jgi:hypothetical protein
MSGMSGAIPLLKASQVALWMRPVLAAERWIASGKLAQIAGCFFDAVQGMSSECTSTTTTARRCPEPTTQVSPRVRTLEFGRLRSTAKEKAASASCAARRRLASSLTSPSLTFDEIRSWRVQDLIAGRRPKFVSPSDPAAQWTGAMRGPAFFAYSDKLCPFERSCRRRVQSRSVGDVGSISGLPKSGDAAITPRRSIARKVGFAKNRHPFAARPVAMCYS